MAPLSDARELEMMEHQSPVRDLPFTQHRAAANFPVRADARRGRRVAQSARPSAIDLAAIALEAARVIPIRTHVPTISESGFPLLARHARALETL
jgi:hypothetical protein